MGHRGQRAPSGLPALAPGTSSAIVGRTTVPSADLPSLDERGRDLLEVAAWRRALSLAMPFALAAGFFARAARGYYVGALLCTVAQSFLTYGSISHDLVHRTLRLPRVVWPALARRLDPHFARLGLRPVVWLF